MQNMLIPKSDLQWQLEIAQAQEDALRSLLTSPIMEVTLRSGTESLTVAVEPTVAAALAEDLLNAAIAHRQQVAAKLGI